MLNILILIAGFVMLIKGADTFVDSASSIAKKFGIPSIIIGMTIVAMGTSAPELSVSINSSLSGMNDMSIANVVGSNLFNLLVVLGVSSLLGKLKITNYKDVIMLLCCSLVLAIFTLNGTISLIEGLILLVIFAWFIFSMIQQAKNNNDEMEEIKQKPLSLTIVLGVIGLAAIVWGGDLVVTAASSIAAQLGMSENLIGLTVVALGTSLPELVTSVMATKKGELDIAVGNVIGSNIFNILLIIGCASVIHPMVVSTVAIIDTLVVFIMTSLFVLLTNKSKEITKKIGIPMIITYIMYMIITIIR
jgi:cation:H+ antiporter